MTRPVSRSNFHRGKTSYHSIQGDLLHVGANPYGYSNIEHATIGIDYATGLKAVEDGWRVGVAVKDRMFLGHLVEETFLYLVIDIPKTFDKLKFSTMRVGQYLSETYNTTVEISAHPWWFENLTDGTVDKAGVRLYLTEIYKSKDDDEDVLYGIDLNDLAEKLRVNEIVVDDALAPEVARLIPTKDIWTEYNEYVQFMRDRAMPVRSRHQWIQDRYKSREKERDYEQHNNHKRTTWVIGEVVGYNGIDYIIGRIDGLGDQWGLRLDRKFHAPVYLRVPK